jgi:hypothetical protein
MAAGAAIARASPLQAATATLRPKVNGLERRRAVGDWKVASTREDSKSGGRGICFQCAD